MAAIEKRFSTEIHFQAEGKKIVGYAAKFMNRSQDLGGFVEQIDPQAFTRTLSEGADVRALIDHNPSLILGRTVSGTLRLATDSTGLLVEITPPDTTYARDLMVSLERGDVTQMSFAFVTKKDKWEKADGNNLRTLLDVDLHDVSAVTYPAYLDTEVGLRSLNNFKSMESEQVAKLQQRLNRVKLLKLSSRARTQIVVADIDNTLLANGTAPIKKK